MPHGSESPQPIRLEDYRPSEYLIDRVDLDVRLAPQQTRVRASLAIRPNPKAAASDAPLVLDGEQLELGALALDGAPLASALYRLTPTRLTIPKVPQRRFVLAIDTRCDPDANTALTGLYRSNGIYCTQCEAEGFRRISYYLDRPDVLARFTTRIEARRAEAPVLLANGNLVAAGAIEDSDRHFALWHDPFPKPSYLFAMVGGNLACVADTFTTGSGRTVELKIYVEPGNEDRCGWALDSLKRAMRWDEQAFGREYDLDVFMVVAVPDFNMGAMENKGLNIFNDKYVLARPDTATDQDYANIEGIIAHEYFHNWTGNRITCRDWFQLCLKEGLTVYRDQEFSADMRSRPVKRIADVRLLRSQQFPEDAGPLAHPVRPRSYLEINNFYTATVYEKGAELVRMLRTLLGATAFRRAMDLYFERHDGAAATVEDFVQCMADASGRDLQQFFRWYSQAGTPEVSASGRYIPAENAYELQVAQATPATPGEPSKEALLIPLALGLIGPDGAELPLDLEGRGVLNHPVVELAAPVQTFRFRNIAARPVASLNRGFAAPIKLTANLSADDLLFLMGHDADPFNRWEAGQTIARRLLLSLSENARRGRRLTGGDALAKALAACLADAAVEPAFAAQMLTLPSEGDLAAEIGRDVDPEAIHRARSFLRAQLGRLLGADLARLYREHMPSGAYTPDAANCGHRALRNTSLDYLAHADRTEGPQRALAHFEGAANMTDAVAALATLSQIDCAERERALETFYRRHRGDPLVVDKWLALNAMTPFPGTPQRVRDLMGHEAFVLTTPNKVRALVGTFASLNPVAFHEASGAGYRLLADVVLDLDPINPQVAARLAANFKSWRALEPLRRSLAQAEIERIAAAASLSRDTHEIVSRMLV